MQEKRTSNRRKTVKTQEKRRKKAPSMHETGPQKTPKKVRFQCSFAFGKGTPENVRKAPKSPEMPEMPENLNVGLRCVPNLF